MGQIVTGERGEGVLMHRKQARDGASWTQGRMPRQDALAAEAWRRNDRPHRERERTGISSVPGAGGDQKCCYCYETDLQDAPGVGQGGWRRGDWQSWTLAMHLLSPHLRTEPAHIRQEGARLQASQARCGTVPHLCALFATAS